MKKNLLFLFVSLILVFGVFIFSRQAFADNNSVSNVVLSKDEVVEHDYFAAGNTVNVSGTINGDAYVAGGNVTFDGIVNGDLIAGGGNVTILGKVNGNVRAAGGNIIFSSDVEKNATILGGSVALSDSGKIAGSLVSAGGTVSVNSPVGKGANIAGGQVNLSNSIGGEVNAYASSLTLNPTAKIAGDLNYWSENQSQINSEASVSGEVKYHYVESKKYNEQKAKEVTDKGQLLGVITAGTFTFYLYSFVVSFIIGLLLINLLPIFTASTVKILENRPGAALGIGFLATILFPATFIVLLITLIGIPLAFVLLIAMIVLWFISETFVALFIGTKVLNYFRKEESSKGWSLFTGLIILGVLSLIPVISFFAGTLTYLFGLGALLIQKKNSYSLMRQKQLI